MTVDLKARAAQEVHPSFIFCSLYFYWAYLTVTTINSTMSNTTTPDSPPAPPFVWTGDLADDCWCEYGPYFAHAEMMVDDVKINDDGSEWKAEIWWFNVTKNGKEIFNSSNFEGTIFNGKMCRALAEAIMAVDTPNAPSASSDAVAAPDNSHKPLPQFTCGTCGGLAAIWWGEGDYLCGFGIDQMRLVEILCNALNDKLAAMRADNITVEAPDTEFITLEAENMALTLESLGIGRHIGGGMCTPLERYRERCPRKTH